MNTHILLQPQLLHDIDTLPAPFNTWSPELAASDPLYAKSRSKWHAANRPITLLRPVVLALNEMLRDELLQKEGKNPALAIVKVGEETYSTEMPLADTPNDSVIFRLMPNGKTMGAIYSKGDYQALPVLGGEDDRFDTTAIFAALIMQLFEYDNDYGHQFNVVADRYTATTDFDHENVKSFFYKISDALSYGLLTENLKCTLTGGKVEAATRLQVEQAGVFSGNDIICGRPKILVPSKNSKLLTSNNVVPFALAKSYFEEFVQRESMDWSPEEQLLIPSFPDDFPVPPETIFFCNRYVNSHNDKRPMINFMWRGTTSYGKSTGVELMAAILNRPLLRMTCSSNMDTQDFLSEIIPNDNKFEGTLPSLEDINSHPAAAYQLLTGIQDESATPEEAFQAYTEVISSKATNAPLYKHVRSNYVRALEHGYICEIQEVSRIKDSGVLVGLNEYDKPGCLIPLANGEFTRRHPDAIVMYTDNVGYVSCRPIDPSVIRRMDVIKDSYELSKEQVIERIKYNTTFNDDELLNKLYLVWKNIQRFCQSNDIVDGMVSVTELERWCQSVIIDGYSNVYNNCLDCVVSKASSIRDEQEDIISSVLKLYLSE